MMFSLLRQFLLTGFSVPHAQLFDSGTGSSLLAQKPHFANRTIYVKLHITPCADGSTVTRTETVTPPATLNLDKRGPVDARQASVPSNGTIIVAISLFDESTISPIQVAPKTSQATAPAPTTPTPPATPIDSPKPADTPVVPAASTVNAPPVPEAATPSPAAPPPAVNTPSSVVMAPSAGMSPVSAGLSSKIASPSPPPPSPSPLGPLPSAPFSSVAVSIPGPLQSSPDSFPPNSMRSSSPPQNPTSAGASATNNSPPSPSPPNNLPSALRATSSVAAASGTTIQQSLAPQPNLPNTPTTSRIVLLSVSNTILSPGPSQLSRLDSQSRPTPGPAASQTAQYSRANSASASPSNPTLSPGSGQASTLIQPAGSRPTTTAPPGQSISASSIANLFSGSAKAASATLAQSGSSGSTPKVPSASTASGSISGTSALGSASRTTNTPSLTTVTRSPSSSSLPSGTSTTTSNDLGNLIWCGLGGCTSGATRGPSPTASAVSGSPPFLAGGIRYVLGFSLFSVMMSFFW